MEKVQFNPEIVKSFLNDEYNNNNPESDSGEASAIKGLNEAASYLLRTLDTLARRKDDRLGTDPQTVEMVGELSVLVAKRNISMEVLKNTPEFFLGAILTGLAVEKGLTLSTIRKEQAGSPPAPANSEPQNDGENE